METNQYEELFARFRKYGFESFLEVVSYNEEEHFRGVDLAIKMGADNLIGGMPQYTKKTVTYLKQKESKIRFFPYIGKIKGHPITLDGTIEQIIHEGKDTERSGISGINLLVYRYTNDQKALLQTATRELNVPLVVAGSVASFAQIKDLKEAGVWAFTIGGAILEKRFVENGYIEAQIQAVLSRL